MSVIDTSSNKVISTISLPQGPQGVAFSPSARPLMLTHGNSVAVISTSTNTISRSIPVGAGAYGGCGLSRRVGCVYRELQRWHGFCH